MSELVCKYVTVLKCFLGILVTLVGLLTFLFTVIFLWPKVDINEFLNSKSIACSEVICAASQIRLPTTEPNASSKNGIFIWLLKNDRAKASSGVMFQDVSNCSKPGIIYIKENDDLFPSKLSGGKNVTNPPTNILLQNNEMTIKSQNMNVRTEVLHVIAVERIPTANYSISGVSEERKNNMEGDKLVYPFVRLGGNEKLQKLSILTPMGKLKSHILPVIIALLIGPTVFQFLQQAYRTHVQTSASTDQPSNDSS